MAASPKNTAASLSEITVSVLGETKSLYAMYNLEEVSREGAFLSGALVLEKGEELTVELAFLDGTKLQMAAEVADVALGADGGIQVSFARAEERLKDSLAKKLA